MSESKKQTGFFEAPPQTMFFFGLVTGIAITLLAQSVFGGGGGARLAANNGAGNQAAVPSPTQQVPTTPTNVTVPELSNDDYVRGNRNADIVLYEYSDLQCPFCQRFHSTMNSIVAQYGDDVAWAYRHLPLTSIHPEAEPGALAAECVGEQAGDEGFFEFIDGVFAQQSAMGPSLYESLAEEIGVNMNQFNDCVDSGKYLSKIQSQTQSAVSQGIGATPSTVVNGQLIEGAESQAKFDAIIQSLL